MDDKNADFFKETNNEATDTEEEARKRREFFESVDKREPSFEEDEEFFKRQEEFFKQVERNDEKDKDGDPTFFAAVMMSKDEVIEEVKKDGMFLSYVSGRFGDDFEVVSYAVENNGNAITYASRRIQADDKAAEFFVETKKNEILEAKRSGQDEAILVELQHQVETINSVHAQAKRALERSNGMHM